VEDRCIILEGDNRVTAPKVCTGQIPSFGLTHELQWRLIFLSFLLDLN
jgi:hypothetical protein